MHKIQKYNVGGVLLNLQNQEEWVYVEGIKGMTKDMKENTFLFWVY